MNRENCVKHLKTTAQILGYASMACILTTGLAWAHLDDQVDKATTLVLGKVAPLIIGAATVFGGGAAAINGSIAKACAIFAVGGITGIGIALARSGDIFKLLQ